MGGYPRGLGSKRPCRMARVVGSHVVGGGEPTGLVPGGLGRVAGCAETAPVPRVVRIETSLDQLGARVRIVVSIRRWSALAPDADGVLGEYTLTEPAAVLASIPSTGSGSAPGLSLPLMFRTTTRTSRHELGAATDVADLHDHDAHPEHDEGPGLKASEPFATSRDVTSMVWDKVRVVH